MLEQRIWKVAEYPRLSDDDADKDESNSIINQILLMDAYLKQKKDMVVVGVYKDDGYTGTNFNRPGFQEMMAAIERKEVDCVIVKDLSRLGRDHIDTDRYVQKIFPSLGVRFISINDNYDSLTATVTDTHLVVPMKNFVNETYSRQTSQRVRSHLAVKRNIGDYVGAYAPYGYKKSTENKNKIVIDPVAAKNVKQIFEWRKEGKSNMKIADLLNQLGIPSPAEYKRSVGMKYQSAFQTHMIAKWAPLAVKRILTNPIYCGILEQGKRQKINYKLQGICNVPKEKWVVIENNHEAIIDKNTFNLVQNIIKLDTRVAPGKEDLYLFSGLLVCADCGRNLVRRTYKYKEKTKVFYICTTYNRQEGCTRHSIKEEELMPIVENSLRLYGNITDYIQTAIDYLAKNQLDTFEVIQQDEEIATLREEMSQCYMVLQSLTENLKKGIIRNREYKLLRNNYQKRISEIQEAISKQEEYIEDLLENKFLSVQWIEDFLAKPDIGKIDRDSVINFIDKIIVHESQKIDIHYRFQDEIMFAYKLAKQIMTKKQEVAV